MVEHRDLVRGATEVEETEDGVRCSRIPDSFPVLKRREVFLRRARYTSGVRISLVTDSSFISLRLHLNAVEDSPDTCRVDVLVDRRDCHTFEPEDSERDFEFFLQLPADLDKDHEVEVFLPLNAEALVRELELSDGALFRPLYCTDERMLLLGDCLTMGLTATSPLRSYAAILAAELHTDILNWAIAGLPLCSEFGKLALEYEWQSVLVACGTQEYEDGVGAADCAASLSQLMRQLCRRPGIVVYVATPFLCPAWEEVKNAAGDTLADFRVALTSVAASCQARLIDGARLFRRDACECYDSRESRRLSDEGMEAVAEGILKKLARLR